MSNKKTSRLSYVTVRPGAVAIVGNKDVSVSATVATAHAVMVSSCELKSPMRCSTDVANAAKNDASFWPALANAQAVLPSSCGLKSPMGCCAAVANVFIGLLLQTPMLCCRAPAD